MSRLPARAFSLIELVVVMGILSILGALTLAGLSGAATKSKQETTEFMINRLNDAIMDWYEEYEDLARPGLTNLVMLRLRMREEMPDSWADVGVSTSYAAGRAYLEYKKRGYSDPNDPNTRHPNLETHQGAECLYMIVTRSGRFPNFLEEIRPDRVGDLDGDGLKEFWDGWNRPITFLRWAPGFVQPGAITSLIQIDNPATHHDPLDVSNQDSSAFLLIPLICSDGPDGGLLDPLSDNQGHGLITASNGWPVLSGEIWKAICTFEPNGSGRVGAPDPSNPNAYLDNITNHDLMAR